MLRPKLALNPARRVARPGRRRSRGQSLVIFGLSAIVLFGICGLAIDSGASYLIANRVERAASAGALAGVTYMPDQYSPQAINAAKAAVQRNGYVDDGCVSVCVNVYKVPRHCDDAGSTTPCVSNRLGVEVATQVSNTFTKVLGFGPQHWVRQQATAEFLSTLTLGEPSPHLGSTQAQIGANPQQGFYFLRTEGWGTPRSEGDAYTPNPNGSADVHTITVEPNVPPSSPTGAWNSFPTCGGYNFEVKVPTNEPVGRTVRLEVYNPAFAPDGPNSYRENDGTFSSGTAAQYDTMMYTLFKENDRFDRTTDSPLAQVKIDPLNATDSSQSNWKDERTGTTLQSSTISTFYQKWVDTFPSGGLTDSTSIVWTQGAVGGWNDSLTPGSTYRLRVDTLDGTGAGCSASGVAQGAGGGHKGYAVRVVDQADSVSNNECAGCTIGGINELAFYTPLVASGSSTQTFDVPMVNVPAVYAGQTINLYAYDPGDVGGVSNYIDVINPCIVVSGSCTTGIASDPSKIKVYDLGVSKATTPTASLLLGSHNWPDTTKARVLTYLNTDSPQNPYNGHWLLFKIPVPSTYAPTTLAQQYWSLRYELTGGTATDTLTISVGFDGPPVHLVPNP